MRLITIALLAAFLLISCGQKGPEKSVGQLEITFAFNKPADESVEPSYQLAVWLEDVEGNYIKTLQLAEYLSIGGYNDTTICSNWIKKAVWDTVSIETADAVTKATPPIGLDTLLFEIDLQELKPSVYQYCLQAHIIEDYNIQFTGKINIGTQSDENVATVSFSPTPYKDAENIISDVKAKYLF